MESLFEGNIIPFLKDIAGENKELYREMIHGRFDAEISRDEPMVISSDNGGVFVAGNLEGLICTSKILKPDSVDIHVYRENWDIETLRENISRESAKNSLMAISHYLRNHYQSEDIDVKPILNRISAGITRLEEHRKFDLAGLKKGFALSPGETFAYLKDWKNAVPLTASMIFHSDANGNLPRIHSMIEDFMRDYIKNGENQGNPRRMISEINSSKLEKTARYSQSIEISHSIRMNEMDTLKIPQLIDQISFELGIKPSLSGISGRGAEILMMGNKDFCLKNIHMNKFDSSVIGKSRDGNNYSHLQKIETYMMQSDKKVEDHMSVGHYRRYAGVSNVINAYFESHCITAAAMTVLDHQEKILRSNGYKAKHA